MLDFSKEYDLFYKILKLTVARQGRPRAGADPLVFPYGKPFLDFVN
jgi:hypothetical protein